MADTRAIAQAVWRRLPRTVRRSRLLRGSRERFSGTRIIRTLAELDAELDRMEGGTYDEHKRLFSSFRMQIDRGPDLDPHSAAYRMREWKLYEFLSGKPYTAANEVTRLDTDAMARLPFPYFTESATAVGDQLMAIGFLIKSLGLPSGSSVLEFGCGWGNLTIALARTGYDVTAVDIAPDFLEVVRRRADQEGCDVTLIEGDFTVAAEIERRFDAVVFFESFHHARDHEALIRELDHLVAPGGKVVFAAEPITDDFEVPWGIRLDGESLWAIRRNGWFETGFTERYFRDVLGRAGWRVTKRVLAETPWGVVFVATR